MTQRIVFGIAGAVLLFFTVWLGWRHYHPQVRGCAHSIALCHPADAAKATSECAAVLAELGQRRGGAIERMAAHCMLDAENCNESISCLSHADRRANALK